MGYPVVIGFCAVAILMYVLVREERRPTQIASYLMLAGVILAHGGGWLYSTHAFGVGVRDLGLFLEGLAVLALLWATIFHGVAPKCGWRPPRILQDVTSAATFIIWSLFWLQTHGVDLAGIIATSAVLTAVIGLSMQDTLGNIVSGLAIQLDTSVRVGDWIRMDDVVGRVSEIRWRYTAVETRNWETVLIPNTQMVKNKIVVLGRRTDQPVQLRRWVWFNVDFRTSPDVVIETVQSAVRAAEIPRVATNPLPNCVLMDYSESWGRYALRYWLTELAIDDPTDSEVRTHIYYALQRKNIRLSMPAHAVFLTEQTAERKANKASHHITDRMAALNSVDLFSILSQEEKQHLAEKLVEARFFVGDIVTRQGAEAHWLYIIIDGHGDVMVEDGHGHTTRVGELGPGNFFGEWSLLTGEPRHATVLARTAMLCYRLNREGFQELISARPAIAEELSAVVAQHKVELDAAMRHMSDETRRETVEASRMVVLQRIREFFRLEVRN